MGTHSALSSAVAGTAVTSPSASCDTHSEKGLPAGWEGGRTRMGVNWLAGSAPPHEPAPDACRPCSRGAPALYRQPRLRACATSADQRGLLSSDSTCPTTMRVALQAGGGEGERGREQHEARPVRAPLPPSFRGSCAAQSSTAHAPRSPRARQAHVDAPLVGHKPDALGAALRADGGEEGHVFFAALQSEGGRDVDRRGVRGWRGAGSAARQVPLGRHSSTTCACSPPSPLPGSRRWC